MVRACLVVLIGALALVGTVAGAARAPLRLELTPVSPHALDPTHIVLRSATVAGLRVQTISPGGRSRFVPLNRVTPSIARGVVHYGTAGRWQVRVVEKAAGSVRLRRTVMVLPAVVTPPPPDFGPLGAENCSPPSPANTSTQGFREIFGTAVGHEELWALPFVPRGASWAQADAAAFDGLVGKEIKIVFAMTAMHLPFTARGPGGQTLAPAWGPSLHSSSNWARQPGSEWGAGFVFPTAGCWRVDVGVYGTVWLLLRS